MAEIFGNAKEEIKVKVNKTEGMIGYFTEGVKRLNEELTPVVPVENTRRETDKVYERHHHVHEGLSNRSTLPMLFIQGLPLLLSSQLASNTNGGQPWATFGR